MSETGGPTARMLSFIPLRESLLESSWFGVFLFLFFFNVSHFSKVSIEFVTVLLLFPVLVFWP